MEDYLDNSLTLPDYMLVEASVTKLIANPPNNPSKVQNQADKYEPLC